MFVTNIIVFVIKTSYVCCSNCLCFFISFLCYLSKCVMNVTGIGERDDILPHDEYNDNLIHDLKSSVLAAGWLLLDSYLSLSRKAMSSIELANVEDFLMLSNYCSLELQVWKNVLLNKSIKEFPKEIKPHTTMHFIRFWKRDGTPRTYSAYMLEAAHPEQVKHVYHSSSRRRVTLLSEMFLRYMRMKLVVKAKSEFNKARDYSDIGAIMEEDKVQRGNNKSSVVTEAGVVIECSKQLCDREELKFCQVRNDLVFSKRSVNENDFLNPTCNLSFVWEQLQKVKELYNEMDFFCEGVEGKKV